MPASMNIDQAKGKNAGGPITKKRFVKLDPNAADGETCLQCDTEGEDAFGVALYSVSGAEILRGKGVSVITDGRAIVEAGEALKNMDAVMTGADGKAYKATTGKIILGMVDEPAAAAGNECSVALSLASNVA